MPFLEFLFDPSRGSKRIPIAQLPFLIGRDRAAHFTVPSPVVSGRHAELFERDGKFWIRDLRSRNGTHVNGQAVLEATLADGDIIHVAHSEFRFFLGQTPDAPSEILPPPRTDPIKSNVPPSVLHGKPMLAELIAKEAIRVIFQPIVDLNTGNPFGYEALGRGCIPQLTTRPMELFHLAKLCGLSVELSRAFRRVALRQAAIMLPPGAVLFCNLHPAEVAQFAPDNLDHLLFDAPRPADNRPLVLEVHEETATDLAKYRWLRGELRSRRIGLAFDDFGIGQSRLPELADAPPQFVKIDQQLIRDVDSAAGRRNTVQAICELAAKLGVKVIAEGIEHRRELETCLLLGCGLGQGFLLGHPEFAGPPLKRFEATTATHLPTKPRGLAQGSQSFERA